MFLQLIREVFWLHLNEKVNVSPSSKQYIRLIHYTSVSQYDILLINSIQYGFCHISIFNLKYEDMKCPSRLFYLIASVSHILAQLQLLEKVNLLHDVKYRAICGVPCSCISSHNHNIILILSFSLFVTAIFG